ncbi:MAG: response regulator [Bacteroidota bacterium]
MSKITVLIVEDEPLYADQLELLIDRLGYEFLAVVDNGRAALEMVQQQTPDLILMDIYIQGNLDGIELTEKIHERHLIPTIFITSLRDELTFRRASRTKATHFIVKPFEELQLQRVIEMTVQKLQVEQPTEDWSEDILHQDHFFVKHNQRLEKIAIADIRYFEADGHYCALHLAAKKYLLRQSLQKLLAQLPEQQFLQTHRSYVVNQAHITSVDLAENVIYLQDQYVPLSMRKKEGVLERLKWIG